MWVFWGVYVHGGRLLSGWAQAFVPHLHLALFEWQVYMDATSAANMLWDHGNNRSSLGSYAASFLTIRHERNNFRCQKRNCDKRKHFGFHGTGVCPEATALIKKSVSFFTFTINPWLSTSNPLAYMILTEKLFFFFFSFFLIPCTLHLCFFFSCYMHLLYHTNLQTLLKLETASHPHLGKLCRYQTYPCRIAIVSWSINI